MKEEVYLYNTHEEMIANLVIAGNPLAARIAEIQELYLRDDRPWIIGFSGGKDSTTILSLVYAALLGLKKKELKNPVYVVSSDTLVETPVVIDMIKGVLDKINVSAKKLKLPVTAHPVYPKTDKTFWVNLLGRGYPAPSTKFRWCTERLKIDPVSEFITEKVMAHGEVIVVLGSRSQESASRAQVIARHSIEGSVLSRHTSLPNAYTYMPIANWSADEVWEYLMSAPNPWGSSNRELFELYKGSNQGECPLVIDKSTPSCGNSRFGCWTCTVVTEDKAIHGLIESGAKWMKPLLAFRNKLYESALPANASTYRNAKRRTGKVTFNRLKIEERGHKHIRGPYLLTHRKDFLKELLEIERGIRDGGHDIELIQRVELQAIRQQWLRDPNEPDWQDSLPKIFKSVYPQEQIEWIENDAGIFTEPDADLLQLLGKKYDVPAEMIMKLMEVELQQTGLSKRKGILDQLEFVLNRDWEDFEEVRKRHTEFGEESLYAKKIKELQEKHDHLKVAEQ